MRNVLKTIFLASMTLVCFTEESTTAHLVERGFVSSQIQKGEIASLLIGINYEASASALSNCIKDIDHVLGLVLRPKLAVKDENIIYMSDKKKGTPFYPTKANIWAKLREFSCLINQSKNGYFHYSGHGTRVKDFSFDEEDGFDEALVPVDYASSGMIVDDELFDRFIKALDSDVNLLVVTDCCHSGTIMDLPFLWNEYGQVSKEHSLSSDEIEKLPFVIALSGCKDSQTSADGGPLLVQKESSGALTAAYLAVLNQYHFDLTYRQLLIGVNQLLKKFGFDQRPQLSSTKPIKLEDKFLSLETEFAQAR